LEERVEEERSEEGGRDGGIVIIGRKGKWLLRKKTER
jgi:hypothetical protein